MKNNTSLAPSKSMFYIWNDKKTIFVKYSDGVSKAFDETSNFYKSKINPKIEEWQLLSLPLTISRAPQEVNDFFIRTVFEKIVQSDLSIGIDNFDYLDSRDRQILIDVIYCLNENIDDLIEFSENIEAELHSVNLTKLEGNTKSFFTKNKNDMSRKKLHYSLAISQIASFIADSNSIICKLKNNTFISLANGEISEHYGYEYEVKLASYS